MTDLIRHPYAQALAWALVHFLWQGAAIGLAVFGVLRVARLSASARYVIGVAALAVMLVAPALTFTVLARVSATTPAAPVASVRHVTPAGRVEPAGRTQPGEPAAPVDLARAAAPAGRADPAGSLVAVLAVWTLGVAFFSLRLLGGWLMAQRLTRRAIRPVTPDIAALARRVAGRLALERIVSVFESSAVVVPMMVGWLKPAVLLPAAALSGLTPTQIEALLAHELAHVRRHDYLVNLLQSVVETLLFYHPAVWWVSRDVRAAREHCCDDMAVGVCDRLVYATALADLAAMTPAPRLALAATDGSLVSRVRRILGQPRESKAPTAAWLPLLFVTLLVGALMPSGLISARADVKAQTAARADAQRVRHVAGVDQGVVAGVPEGVASGVTAGLPGGVAGGVAAGVPGGIAGGVAGGVTGGVGQGRSLSADEQARLEAELKALARERTQQLDQQRASVEALQRELDASRSQLGLATTSGLTASALQAQQVKALESKLLAALTGGGASASTLPALGTGQFVGTAATGQTESGTGSLMWSNDGESVAVKWTGAFTLSDDDKDIAWVEPGKSVQVSDGKWLFSTGVEIKGLADGKLEHTYYRHGLTQPYEPEGRQFLAAILQRAVHRSGLGAAGRVARFLKQGGPNAVLAEIDTLEGDFVRRVYYQELIKQGKLSPADLTRVATRIADTIHSDFELATLIASVAKQPGTDDTTRVTLADATRTLTSDFERHRALSALVVDHPSPKVVAAVLRNAGSIRSDFERARLLMDIAAKGGLTSETKQAFFDLVTTMHSSFDQSRVLRAVTGSADTPADVRTDVLKTSRGVGSDFDRRQVLSAALGREVPLTSTSATGVLEATSSMRSDDDRASVLLELIRKDGLTGETADQFFAAVCGMHSTYEQRRVLEAVAMRAAVPESIAIGLLKATATIRGDNDRAEVLIGFARRHAVTSAARPFYLAAADGIRSDYEQTRALAELVRSERRVK